MIQSFLNHPTRIVKLISSICFFSIGIICIIAYLNPQQGYELSFYESTPQIVFVLIGICITGGIIILFHQAYYGYYKITKTWLIGFLVLLITRIVILYLPYIRNYHSWMGDPSTHLGIVRDMILTGRINQGNFYPIVHIYLTQYQIITLLPVEFIVNHSTAILSVLFVLSTYLLAKSIFFDNKPILLTLATTGCVFFSGYDLYLMPNGWSCLYLPFVVYLILKSMNSENGVSFRILAIIAMVLYPFFHPLSTILLIILLLLIVILGIFFRYSTSVLRISKGISSNHFNYIPWILLVIIGAIWIPWLVSFKIFNMNIRNFFDSIFTGETTDVVGGITAKLDKMNLNIWDIINLFIKQNGDELIFFILFFIGLVIVMKYPKLFKNFFNIVILTSVTLFFGSLYFLYLFSLLPGLGSINAQRIFFYIYLVTPVFAGITYTYAISRKKMIINIFCIFLLITPSLLTLFATFPSPYVYRPTPEITQMDLKGMEWTIDFKDPDLPFLYIMSPLDRFADIILGVTERQNRRDISKYTYNIQNHFNYNNNRFFGQMYVDNSYAVITKFDTIIYDTVYLPVGRFHYSDFQRFQIDNTVNRIYSNKETTVYYILGQNDH